MIPDTLQAGFQAKGVTADDTWDARVVEGSWMGPPDPPGWPGDAAEAEAACRVPGSPAGPLNSSHVWAC